MDAAYVPSRRRKIERVVLPPNGDSDLAAAEIAEASGLTCYDSAYAAGARSRGAALATADQALLSAGAGERAGAIAARLGT